MGLMDYIKPVPTKTADEVRELLNTHDPEEYNLIDVRQPGEYAEGHLPGAQLIPSRELLSRLDELDPDKPTITYWTSGLRSRAAAGALLNAGFREAYNMDGGIIAWDGLVAEGTPDAGMAYFSNADKPDELITLAWIMEDGSRRFYHGISEAVDDSESASLFKTLTKAEDHHKEALVKLYSELVGTDFAEAHESIVSGSDRSDIMEGGMKVTEALSWAENKDVGNILELAMSLEINAYDLYILLGKRMGDNNSKKVFHVLAEEEKQHLDRLAKVLDNKIG